MTEQKKNSGVEIGALKMPHKNPFYVSAFKREEISEPHEARK